MSLTPKLSSKFQATVPEQVRHALQLRPGDLIGFDAQGNVARLRRASSFDLAFAQGVESALAEWSSAQDDAACKNL